MVRSSLAPGPYEGQCVLDRDGEPVGRVLRLNVTGQTVTSFTVEASDGRAVEVPRDLFSETTAEGLVMSAPRSELFTEAAVGQITKP